MRRGTVVGLLVAVSLVFLMALLEQEQITTLVATFLILQARLELSPKRDLFKHTA